MKKLFFLSFVILQSCNSFHNLKLKKEFKAEKNTLWANDKKNNLYYIKINYTKNEGGVELWKKYKEYLTGKDTTFILKQFGKPNFNNRSKRKYEYYVTTECESLFNPNIPEPANYSCTYVEITLDEKYKLKAITYEHLSAQTQN